MGEVKVSVHMDFGGGGMMTLMRELGGRGIGGGRVWRWR